MEEQEAAAAQSVAAVEQERALQARKAAQARERVEAVMGELQAAVARLAEAEVGSEGVVRGGRGGRCMGL